MKRILSFLSLALLAACSTAPVAPQKVADLASPDGKLHMEFLLDEAGTPYYALSREGTAVLTPGRLGFSLRGVIKAEKLVYNADGTVSKQDGAPTIDLDRGFELAGTGTDSFDETWEPVWGEESQIRNHYNELLVHLRQPESDRLMDIRFRLFDDGLGFRYEFPAGQSLVHFVIREELTEFACADDWTAWWIPGDYDTQEFNYTESRLSQVRSLYWQSQKGGGWPWKSFSETGLQTALQMKTMTAFISTSTRPLCSTTPP